MSAAPAPGRYGPLEAHHGLPAGVLAAVIAQESGGNPGAVRYEPGFFTTYIGDRPRTDLGGVWPIGVSEPTERVCRATSWGLMQVMGQVARERGFAAPFFTLLCTEPEIGVEYGARHLAAKLKKYGNLSDALSAYNAGRPTTANREHYVLPILRRMG